MCDINVHSLREKVGSKKELYDFLQQECGAYLPKLTCTNVYFLKSIVNGDKEYLKRSDVILAAVPQIEGLTVEDFMEHASGKASILKYLPDQCDWLHLDKRWITDLLLTLDFEGVSLMIKKAKEARRQKLDSSQNLIVKMRPEFAQALENSLYFSGKIHEFYLTTLVHKGRSAHLLKPGSKRKRNHMQIEEEKKEDSDLRQSKQRYLDENKRVREEYDKMQAEISELAGYKNLVISLHQSGLINEEGAPMIDQQPRSSYSRDSILE